MPPIVVTEELLVKYAAGEADAAEQQVVQHWLSLNAANREQLDDILLLFEQADKLPAATMVDEKAAWQKLRQRLEVTPVKRMHWGWMRVAAILMPVIAATVWFLLPNKQPTVPPAVAMVNVVTEIASQTVWLPDSSMVVLAGHSTLHYPAGFSGNSRTVKLEGEAYFSVAHNRAKPFIVSVKDVTVTVTGTSFTVRAFLAKTEVVVRTGVVRVARGANEVTLLPGEAIILADGDTLLTKHPAQNTVVQNTIDDTVKHPQPPQQDSTLAGDVGRQKAIMLNILQDIAKDKLVPAADSIKWFRLDWKNFIINNEAQPASIYLKYKTKYLHLPGYGFYYGPPANTGKGFVFSKRELEQ